MTRLRAATMQLAAALVLFPALAYAGRPLSTEDAATREDGTCQIEAWADRTRANTTGLFAVPACAVAGVEFQAGMVRERAEGRTRTVSEFVQAKHAFRSIDEAAWGAGMVVGMARFPTRDTKTGWGDPFATGIVSLALGEDKDTRPLLHFNVGAARLGDERRTVTTWGVALEKPVTGRITAVAEAFGENRERPFLRAGGRFAAVDGLDVDLTYVGRSGGSREERFWSLGIHWEPDFLDFRAKTGK